MCTMTTNRPKLEEILRSGFPEPVYGPTLAVGTAQTMLSRLPHSPIEYDPYAEHQSMWTSTVYNHLQHGFLDSS